MAGIEHLTLLVFTTVPWDQALAVLRYRAPAEMMGWTVIPGKENQEDIFPERIDKVDAIIIQRDFPRFYDSYIDIIARARSLEKPIIYEVDDLLINMPSDHPNQNEYSDVIGGLLLGMLDADSILVSSLELQKIFQSITPKPVDVWPNYLPDHFWPLNQTPDKIQPDKVVIGYMGSATHQPDIETLAGVFEQILVKFSDLIEIHFWNCPPPSRLLNHPNIRHYLFDFLVYKQFASEFLVQQADIWVAPLRDNLFNRSKSLIKFWEYAAVGGASVYQAITPYTNVVTHDQNGLLANTPDEWVIALSKLILQPDFRQSLKMAAQDYLIEQGYLSKHLIEWQTLWQKIMTRPLSMPLPSDAEVLASAYQRIQLRSFERNQEVIHLLGEIVSRDQEYIPQVNQLNDILQSRSWQLIQKANKIRGIFKGND